MIRRTRLFAALLVGLCSALGVAAPGSFAAAPAWLPVASSGPTVVPSIQSEVQKLWVDATGGTYKLTVATGGGKVSNASFSNAVTLNSTDYGSFQVGDVVTLKGEDFLPANTTIEAISGSTITLSGTVFSEGTNRSLTSVKTTAPIAHNAPATGPGSLEAALEALPGVGAAGTQISGGPSAANPYTIAFGGPLADADLPRIKPDASGPAGLTGGDATATIATSVPGGPGTTKLAIYAQNIGGYESIGDLSMTVELPDGITTLSTPGSDPFLKAPINPGSWTCTPGSGQTVFTCTYHNPGGGDTLVAPSIFAQPVLADVVAAPGAVSGEVNFEVSGGGAKQAASGSLYLEVGPTPAPPGLQTFAAGAYDVNGVPDTRAGGHPYSASTAIFANTKRSTTGQIMPSGEPKDIVVDLPPGFLGNPTAVPACPESIKDLDCPFPTMVGTSLPLIEYGGSLGGVQTGESAVFNTEAPYGAPAKFRFNVLSEVPLNVVGSLRSDEDYGITAASLNTPQLKPVYGAFFTFWGAPAEKSHDSSRCNNELVIKCGPAAPGDPTAFLTSSVNCAEQAQTQPLTDISMSFWQFPEQTAQASAAIPAVTDCEKLKFEADFTFEPSETKADSTASFRTSLTVPSEGLTNPSKLTTPEIKDTVVQLPEGVVLNASAADGLQACSLSQIGYRGNNFPMPTPMRFDKQPQTCPEASKIGTGELKTALIEEPLQGALYLAAQGDGNPFGSLFAIYLVIEDPRHGIFIKLPGKVEPDERTGQMKVTFTNLPQVPFTRLDLNLKGGNRSALASPTTCGNYVTTATNTPWSYPQSGPPTVSSNGFDINQGPNGMPCANTPQQRPFDIGWSAGAENTKGGASGPFHFRIQRPDGSQELTNLELTTPKGLSASLKGIPYCSGDQIRSAEQRTGREELSSSSCPAASKVGTLTTGAGSGPSPFYVSGDLFLAGPYKGAPISVVAITPAVAGPFDLGNVVVRAAAHIDRTTAQVTAKSDPIPQILKGVSLRIKDVRIKLDRDNWTLNPTNCEASTVNLKASGNSGASTEKSTRFQVSGCKSLAFGPKLSAHLTGGTKRGAHPAFTATVDFPAGQANTKDVQVTLPHSEFLDQAHINTICTRVQAAANACPQGAIYGFAEAESPLIDGKLTGPVFLKSSNHQLPDLAIALKGPDHQPVEVEFQGRIDSIKAQIRNTIEGLPDVPVTKFTLKMKGGRKGLLVNSRNLCKGKVTKMTVKMTGQNNKTSESRPPLTRKCKGGGKAKAKKGK